MPGPQSLVDQIAFVRLVHRTMFQHKIGVSFIFLFHLALTSPRLIITQLKWRRKISRLLTRSNRHLHHYTRMKVLLQLFSRPAETLH